LSGNNTHKDAWGTCSAVLFLGMPRTLFADSFTLKSGLKDDSTTDFFISTPSSFTFFHTTDATMKVKILLFQVSRVWNNRPATVVGQFYKTSPLPKDGI